jgi:hypothetical protein
MGRRREVRVGNIELFDNIYCDTIEVVAGVTHEPPKSNLTHTHTHTNTNTYTYTFTYTYTYTHTHTTCL